MIEPQQELARASAMLDVKRFDEASELLARIVAAEPESSRAWCLMARAHLGADRYHEAVEVANRAVALDPADEWPHRLASNALVHLGNYSDALRAAYEACRLAPATGRRTSAWPRPPWPPSGWTPPPTRRPGPARWPRTSRTSTSCPGKVSLARGDLAARASIRNEPSRSIRRTAAP